MNDTQSLFNTKNRYRDRVSLLVTWGHWYAFFNIIIAMLIGIQYIAASPFPDTFWGQLYLLISWFGHFGFLIFTLYILVLFPLTFLVPSFKVFRILSVFLTTIGFTLLILDVKAYEISGLHINPAVWELLLGNESRQFSSQWQFLFIVIPAMLLLQIVLSERVWKKQRSLGHKKIGKPAAFLFFLCFITSHLVYVWADASFYRPITNQQANFPLSYPMTARSFMEKHGLLDHQEFLERLDQDENQAEKINYPQDKLAVNGLGKPYNILIVSINSLRADMINADVMPNSYEFAENNQWFKQHYSASNNSYGIFGLFYGIPSSYLPSIKAHTIAPLIISQADDNNYKISTFSDTVIPEDSKLYKALLNKFDVTTNAENSQDVVKNWQAWLNNSSTDPWFSYVELDQVGQFEDRASILPQFKAKTKQPKDQLKARYQSSAYQADQSIANIIESLKTSEQFDNTVVIITSNHGYEFDESGQWGYNSNFSRYQLQVPMIIHWPNKEAMQYDYKTSHLDLSPTLLKEIFDVTNSAYDLSSGHSLFQDNQRPWLLAVNQDHVALVSPKYTTVLDESGNYKVYDENYHRDRKTKPKLSLILQGLSELKRFYSQDD